MSKAPVRKIELFNNTQCGLQYHQKLMPLKIQLIKGVCVFTIEKLDSYYSCVNAMPADDDDISECPKCGTMQIII